MAVELQPLGVSCNVRCRYCYQNPLRDAGDPARSYDLEKMKAAVEAEGGPFVLFGGEPLLLPAKDLEELWAWGLERYGANAVQTNGVLIGDRHLHLFERYHVAHRIGGGDQPVVAVGCCAGRGATRTQSGTALRASWPSPITSARASRASDLYRGLVDWRRRADRHWSGRRGIG